MATEADNMRQTIQSFMPKRKEPKLLSDQLREILDSGRMSRYQLSKEAGVDQGQLSRFVLGKGQLTFRTLDKIGAVLRLRFVQDE